MRVPRPMICLNSVMELMRLSRTIKWQVWASTPVDISCEVVAMTGKVDSGSMKLSSWALPSSLSPVMRNHVFAVGSRQVRVGVNQRLAHPFGVVDVFAEDDGLVIA